MQHYVIYFSKVQPLS